MVSCSVVAVAVAVPVLGLRGVVGEGVPKVVDAVGVAVEVKVPHGGAGGQGADGKELAREFGDHADDISRSGEGLDHGEVGLVDEGDSSLLGAHDVHVAVVGKVGGLLGVAQRKAR